MTPLLHLVPRQGPRGVSDLCISVNFRTVWSVSASRKVRDWILLVLVLVLEVRQHGASLSASLKTVVLVLALRHRPEQANLATSAVMALLFYT